MYTGKVWTSLVYSKYMLPAHEIEIFRYLDQNYGKKCPFLYFGGTVTVLAKSKSKLC